MKLALLLYKYFPFGGLQRDMLAIARECATRGHQVQIFCQSWSGEYPQENNVQVNILPDKKHWWESSANHRKNVRFSRALAKALLRVQPDLVIGFNRIPGVDVYYAADTCFKAKLYRERPRLYRYLPRYRQFMREETALFSGAGKAHILAIAQATIAEYQAFYGTPSTRFTLLPPGIARDRINSSGERLHLLHKELRLPPESKLVLMVGSGFRTKGLDRAIDALAGLGGSLREISHLVVVGDDSRDVFLQQAQQRGVEKQVHFLGGRKDIPRLLRAADILVHPAYRENTGTVLLEAAVSGLPVITTAACGYAHYIADHDLGIVLPLPFQPGQLTVALAQALGNEAQRQRWHRQGLQFAQSADIYNMPRKAVDSIESVAAQKGCH